MDGLNFVQPDLLIKIKGNGPVPFKVRVKVNAASELLEIPNRIVIGNNDNVQPHIG